MITTKNVLFFVLSPVVVLTAIITGFIQGLLMSPASRVEIADVERAPQGPMASKVNTIDQ